jgi:hypothetical protein
MQAVIQDLRFAARQLIKSPAFALTAILSLALGIGATTAVFSVIYAALLNPFPYKDADRIVRFGVWGTHGDGHIIWLNGPQIRLLRLSPAVEDTIVMDDWSLPLTGGEYPEDIETIFISVNGFEFLGEPVLLGRGIQPSDAVEGQDPQPRPATSRREPAADRACGARDLRSMAADCGRGRRQPQRRIAQADESGHLCAVYPADGARHTDSGARQ